MLVSKNFKDILNGKFDFYESTIDEINFINKNEQGRSEVYSLERFGERFDKKISLAYLKGNYEAIPIFK